MGKCGGKKELEGDKVSVWVIIVVMQTRGAVVRDLHINMIT